MERISDIFVPGRVCLFGEHSDWAGSYRRFNSSLLPGQVIIAGTNQGIYARVKPHPDSLVLHSTLPDGTQKGPVVIPMEREALLREAVAGGFYSYAAGVAYHMLTFYQVRGVEIDNYRTDMPVKKGLSSSAAFCVMVARAFNRAYDLKLTVRAEMEAAYQGEILTPSRCGRMDQGCAYGQVPVLMTFDGDLLKTHRLAVHKPLYFLVGDLKGRKDTIRILADLSRAYPFTDDAGSRRVREYLGEINTDIVKRAVVLLESGDAAGLGQLMTEAQQKFDAHLGPACPSELGAPKLHTVLTDPEVQRYVHGGKGVGSQGDGCVQFVARSAAERTQLAALLRERYGMDCFDLDLKPPRAVRKAVIPVAGFGTRMFPASKALKKELFPVITRDGVAKPIILVIIEEALSAGIEEIALIVRDGDQTFFADFFSKPLPPEFYNRLPEKHKRICQELRDIGERITYIPQKEQQGFGHAVYCTREWVGQEPFLLLLGDHLYQSATDVPCARQLLDAFEANGFQNMISLYPAPASDVPHYGTVCGQWLNDDRAVLQMAEFAEKPSEDYARSNLVTPGLPPDHFLCVYGQYVLTPAVFTYLQREIDADMREAGEIQLTTALEAMRKAEGMLGFRVAGQHFDTGLPGPYLQTLMAVAGVADKS